MPAGLFAGLVKLLGGGAFAQSKQSLDGTQGLVGIAPDQSVGPGQAVVAEGLDAAAVVVDRLGYTVPNSGHPQAFTEAARFQPGMDGDLFHAVVVDAHVAAVPTHPDSCADILLGHLVVGASYFHVAVTVDFSAAFLEAFKKTLGQGSQGGFFHLRKMLLYLLAGGAVDTLVSYRAFPLAQVGIDLGQALEPAASQGVVFDVFDRVFHFALVGGPEGSRRHQGKTVVLGKAQ